MWRVYFFQISQVLILLAVVVLWMMWRRRSEYDVSSLTEAQKQEAKRKIAELSKAAQSQASADVSPKIAIETALPDWPKHVSAYEILGIAPGASQEVIETAYRALVKKYHPDRFSSWGGDYQKKAHETVLRLQKARDELLAK